MKNRMQKLVPALLLLLAVAAGAFFLRRAAVTRQKTNEAAALLAAEDYDAAYTLLKELGREDEVAASINERADALLEAGEENEAYELLSGLTDDMSRTKRMGIKRKQIGETRVGRSFTLGRYEQDNREKNGPEPISWIVLAREGDRVLVISRYVLDCRRYDEEYKPVTWETCTLRAWLNGEFLNAAFDMDEQNLICVTHVTVDPNPEFTVDPGNDTEDKLFLLSISEAESYFHPDSTPVPHGSSMQEAERYYHTYSTLYCKPTAYAAAKSGVDFSKNEALGWWLRTPGLSSASAAMANRLGMIDTWGKLVNCEGGRKIPGIRPALWIDLNSLREEPAQ